MFSKLCLSLCGVLILSACAPERSPGEDAAAYDEAAKALQGAAIDNGAVLAAMGGMRGRTPSQAAQSVPISAEPSASSAPTTSP